MPSLVVSPSILHNSIFFLADYLFVQLTDKKIINIKKIITKDCKYLTSTQNLSKVSFNFFCIAKIAKLSFNNNIIRYVIGPANITNKASINWSFIKCK